jgi:hypothetical protein
VIVALVHSDLAPFANPPIRVGLADRFLFRDIHLYSRVIDSKRAMPPLHWPAILAGVALSVVLGLVSTTVLPPIPAAAASFFGLLISGLLAGKLARAAPIYHGALAGAGYVICVALGIVPGGGYVSDPLTDTTLVIASDALSIAAAALGGWCARLWSSSDTGTGR